MKIRLCLLLMIIFCVSFPKNTSAAAYKFEKIASGLNTPVAIVQAPHDSTRLFIVELFGQIRIIKNGKLIAKPFLDLSTRITTEIFGQGLFDIAFDPDYATNGFLYVTYSDPRGNEILARYTKSQKSDDLADRTSGKILLSIPHPHGFHYGGQLAFGPDGYLYYSTGDGGSAADKDGSAQNPKSLLGAMLRLDVKHGDPYTIPIDNPFGNRSELWAKGLRNPWRFSFDSATGDLYLPDVGENVYEEVNFQPAGDHGGENYGWNRYEGIHDIRGGSKDGLTFPVAEYAHIDNNCAVIGGYVYHGSALPELSGQYLLADYCSGKLWTLNHVENAWTLSPFMQTTMQISAFGQDIDGELYVADWKTKGIYALKRG